MVYFHFCNFVIRPHDKYVHFICLFHAFALSDRLGGLSYYYYYYYYVVVVVVAAAAAAAVVVVVSCHMPFLP